MVDDADNDQIQRRIFVDGKTCGTAAGHDNPFALARADGIGGNLRAADGFALLIEQINEKLPAGPGREAPARPTSRA